LGKEPHRDQGMPAKIKEAVFDANLLDPQKVLPEGGEALFDGIFGCNIV